MSARDKEKAELFATKGIEVYTTHHTCVEGDNCTVTVDVNPEDPKPGRATVSMGSYGITFTGHANEALRPAVHFECERPLLKALSDAFAEAYTRSLEAEPRMLSFPPLELVNQS